MTTFQTDSPVICKLIWVELDQNLSNAYIEKRSLDGQFGTGVIPNIAVRNRSKSEDDNRRCLDRHVETPINRDTFFEFSGLVFDTVAVLEYELEVGRRAFLDKIDRDIYEKTLSILIKECRANIPFK